MPADVTPDTQPSDHTTLTEVIDRYSGAGFSAQFEVVDDSGGSLRCVQCQSVAPAAAYAMHSLRRLEGASDPADMMAVAAVTCRTCGADGVVVLTYGPAGDPADADVLRSLDDSRNDPILPANSAPGEAIGDRD